MDSNILGVAGAAASVAILNAVREGMSGNWRPLVWTLASGLVTLGIGYAIGNHALGELFVTGLGASGAYTVASRVGTSIAPKV